MTDVDPIDDAPGLAISYYRRDQAKGITPPELRTDCTYAEHIVRARGKRTRYTSVSLSKDRITDFGPMLYELLTSRLREGNHVLVEHAILMRALRDAAVSGDKGDRLTAVQAQRYANRRSEGLVEWSFDTSRVDRKELYVWARDKVAPYFKALRHG